MRSMRNTLNYCRYLMTSKLLTGGLVALALTVSGGVPLYQGNIALAQTMSQAPAESCSENDVIRCGVNSPEDFSAEMNQNTAGDLPAVYSHYGISADEVASQAVEGTAHQDGTVHVDGQVVATDAMSLGRQQKAYSQPVMIEGKTYHESRSQDVFNSQTLDVMVVMDENNQFKYAIIKDCANPMKATPAAAPPPPPAEPPEPPRQEPPKAEPEPAPAPQPEPQQIEVCREGEIVTIPEDEMLASDEPENAEACQPEPVAPTKSEPELPSTGPAEVIGSALGMGSLAGAGYYFRASRRNLIDSVLNHRK